MPMQYLAYNEELQLLYRRSKQFGYGQCIEIHGLPGAGLRRFVRDFIKTHAPAMEQQNIYCRVISCPKNCPGSLFVSVIKTLDDLLHTVFPEEASTQAQRSALRQLEDYALILHKMSSSDQTTYLSFETHFLKALDICASFREELNVRLFITGFDNARRLFEQDVNYAMLFKLMCENYTDLFSVIITNHRRLAVIALIVEAFSEFASLFSVQIPLKGFTGAQLNDVFAQLEEAFQLSLSAGARDKLQYYCGSNPHRFNMMFTALENLKSDLPAEQWADSTAESLVEQAYQLCRQQMNEQIKRVLNCIQDIQGDGLAALTEALNSPFPQCCDPARQTLFDMQVLTAQDGPSRKTAVVTIPVMEEMVKQMAETKTSVKNRPELRILHLSDMHFASSEDETSAELRKAYIRSFCKQLTGLCQEAPVDYIFITGDIGWSAQKGDYTMASEFICKLLQICGLTPDRLFLCPGNHDVQRSLVEDLHYPTSQKEADQHLTLQKLENNGAAFKNYTDFCKQLKCTPYKLGQHTSYLTGVQVCQDFIVACLNTAWFAKNKEDSKTAWVGKNYVIAIKNKVDEIQDEMHRPVITLMHYPASTWAEADRSNYSDTTNSWGIVSQMSDVVLCGHTHEIADMNCVINDANVFTSGAFYDSQHPAHRFCIYELIHGGYQKKEYRYMNEKWYTS